MTVVDNRPDSQTMKVQYGLKTFSKSTDGSINPQGLWELKTGIIKTIQNSLYLTRRTIEQLMRI